MSLNGLPLEQEQSRHLLYTKERGPKDPMIAVESVGPNGFASLTVDHRKATGAVTQT